ncbi:MAG: isoprenyl transferase [Clostridia bacterium]|nr:isoprenyl transferase [Clostridia bacterium]
MSFFHRKKTEVDFDHLPKHIGIIMDGNGRWAKRRGLPRSAGHARGAEKFKEITTFCGDIGISYVTVYAFSTENWNRPKAEVDALMRLLDEYLERAYDELRGKDVKVRVIGERHMLSDSLLQKIEALEKHTAHKKELTLNLAVSYGGRQEIVNAAKTLAEKAKNGEINPEDITEDTMSSLMYTAGQPDPDLIIRPSGEKRSSNFMVWQSAYSEYWFSNVMWPAFTKNDLLEAIHEYQKRQRRFGAL